MMKTSFARVLCVALVLVHLGLPARSEAAIGLLRGERGVPFAVAGGAAIATGVGLFLASTSSDDLETIVVMQIVGAAVALVGLVLLDEPGGSRTLVFREIGEADAARLALSPIELAEFNSSIDEINSVAQQVGRELAARQVYSMEDSRALWDRCRAWLPSEAAFTAAAKVSAHWLNAIPTESRR
ncbi:MAG TPA: hypothetical protein VM598_05305 [Bdellovibrionota bacterium]|nr:hypothetical protein [Bdellovibrionota bacterium]